MKINNPIEFFNGYDVAAIGPTTKTELENYNINVNIMPEEYTIDGLSKAIINHYKKEISFK